MLACFGSSHLKVMDLQYLSFAVGVTSFPHSVMDIVNQSFPSFHSSSGIITGGLCHMNSQGHAPIDGVTNNMTEKTTYSIPQWNRQLLGSQLPACL